MNFFSPFKAPNTPCLSDVTSASYPSPLQTSLKFFSANHSNTTPCRTAYTTSTRLATARINRNHSKLAAPLAVMQHDVNRNNASAYPVSHSNRRASCVLPYACFNIGYLLCEQLSTTNGT